MHRALYGQHAWHSHCGKHRALRLAVRHHLLKVRLRKAQEVEKLPRDVAVKFRAVMLQNVLLGMAMTNGVLSGARRMGASRGKADASRGQGKARACHVS
jgi:hypothetical protein